MVRHIEFSVHMLNENGLERAAKIRDLFDALLSELENQEMCVSERELSIIKTKLEEAFFFAKKSMSKNIVNQKL